MKTQHSWRMASMVGLVALSLAVPGWARQAATRHSGSVVEVDQAVGARWLGEFVVTPQGAWEVKPEDWLTIEIPREGKRPMTLRVTVSELDDR